MVEIRKPIQVTEAVKRVMENAPHIQTESIPLEDSDNRILQEPVIAHHAIPLFDKSPYDGFALRSVDTNNATKDKPSICEVVDHIGAGELPAKALEKGEATRIMTGAQIPEGADCVVMFEKCHAYEKEHGSYISLDSPLEAGENVIEEGQEVKKGETLIAEGTLINPGVKAVLATFGYKNVLVAKKPLVGIIATGTELLDVDEALEPGKIRNSNAYMTASQVLRAEADYIYIGKLADDLENSFQTIEDSLEKVDILITTGGVSVGDFDLMPEIYHKLSADILFNKVAMRPGSVTTVAKIDEQILFGLSGNPSACYVGFELFARPYIQSMLGVKTPYLQHVKATLAEDFPKQNPFTRFVRSFITYGINGLSVQLAGMDKSNVVTSLAHTNCLMMLPGNTGNYKKGDTVDCLLLENVDGQQTFQ
ncbi:MAG TPA: gephyrin-like molybdotransferase Glp [Bacillota bacterium]|nr:gephyrin-like molybdotransferase Glp [Bacillota bacterium]